MKSLVTALLAAGLFAPLAMADGPIELRTAPGEFASEAEARDRLEWTLRGAPARIVFIDPANGLIRLQGSAEAALALRSDPAFISVVFDDVGEHRERVFEVLLDGDGLQAAPLARGRGDRLALSDTGWPGEFVRVIARDAAGEVVADGYVRDHRFVRYEGWAEDGSHIPGSNASFVSEADPLDLWVTLPEAAASIEIRSTLDPDAGETRLGRADVRIAEDGE